MNRLWEFILGLEKGFLSREGDFGLQFNPQWPLQQYVGAALWNLLLVAAAVGLVLYVYRREGRSRRSAIALGVIRMALLLLVIMLLNRPVLRLEQKHVEPSVLAVLIDDSISMRVRDGATGGGPDAQPKTRLEAAVDLLSADNQALMRELANKHTLRLYRFDQDAQLVGSYQQEDGAGSSPPTVLQSLSGMKPDGQHTQVIGSIRTVLQDLQGQRLAGVVVLTDGRDTPAQPLAEALAAMREMGTKVYPVPVGSSQAPANIEIQSVNVQDAAFKDDIVNLKAAVRISGFDPNHPVKLVLKDKKTQRPLYGVDGRPVEQTIQVGDDGKPVEVELQFQPREVGTLDVQVEAEQQPGEIDSEDNIRLAQVAVLDARIVVLYVDGYPRWEYRYIKNEMMRDKTMLISCLLTSADPAFAQEGTKPIRQFPLNMDQLMEYDVVLFGDVDPRQFTDAQLQMISDFVAKKGGGFGMVAGPQWSPQAYRNTPIEPILPVGIGRVEDSGRGSSGGGGTIRQGFRPALTREGASSSIFRFFADRADNEQFLKDEIPQIYWYCRGVVAKPGIGEVYAEHPLDSGPDGRKAPILVLGRFGGGRTLFSAIDDSWRWRYYTGESVFDTYWVQQIRYLARSKKLGQRRMTFTSLRPAYELGEQVRLNLRVLDAGLLQQLPEQLRVEIRDEAGQVLRQESLIRQDGQNDLYIASYTADRIGRFAAHLPPAAGGVEAMTVPVEVATPRLELSDPRVDRVSLSRIASETMGETIEYAEARSKLPALIASAAKTIPVETSQPLWDAPLALLLFVGLITAEWVLRKMYGML